MPDLPRALAALQRMAWLLDEAAPTASRATGRFRPAQLAAGRSRYARVTNEYRDQLISAYETWTRWLLRQLDGDAESQKAQIAANAQGLARTLQQIGTEHLPYAVTAIGTQDYVPSADAWRMIADAVDAQNSDIATKLVPYVVESLQRGVDEATDLAAVADSLLPRVSFYAGNLWVVINRLVGDFAGQAATRDDLIYPCRWVLDPQAQHCDSCPAFAGEYPSYDAMLAKTFQCVPGYFVGSPYKKSCWLNCRCKLQLQINGEWVTV